jgi:hypothetical protein
MAVTASSATCLNCGARLNGAFCSECGQRALAPYPTVREMVGDAWQELSGWDGRFVRTFRVLLGRPGQLTVDTLEGRRVRYITPVRLYLVASVAYFLCAVSVPNLGGARAAALPSGLQVTIVDDSGKRTKLSPEAREEAFKQLNRAPWWAKVIVQPILNDPAAFRIRVLETMPRVLFALLPVFATIVALFYRRRRFSQHLVFALHLHAVVFIVLMVRELSQLARSMPVLRIFELSAAVTIAAYSLMAFRRVYGESWPRVVAKSAGIAAIYCVAGIAALLVTVLWAAMAA